MNSKEIVLGFENCDEIHVDGKYVAFEIEATSSFRGPSDELGIKLLQLAIHRDANILHYEFEQPRYPIVVFDRIIHIPDIAEITVVFEDDKSRSEFRFPYIVEWPDDSDNFNRYQDTYLGKSENLYIVISKDKTVEDCFDESMMDDPHWADRLFQDWRQS